MSPRLHILNRSTHFLITVNDVNRLFYTSILYPNIPLSIPIIILACSYVSNWWFIKISIPMEKLLTQAD